MKSFFNPKSIAIVGVSQSTDKIGTVIYRNLINGGYKGDIFIINPKYSELFERRCYKNLQEIEKNIDTVCIAIPAEYVLDIVKQAVQKKVKSLIIISAGFKEAGEEGIKYQEEICKISKENGIRILGPNCIGMIVPENNLNLSFAQGMPLNGDIAFLSQSGAFGTAILDVALKDNLGFSHFVSIGNKADISELDLIENWLEDDKVKVIATYLEEISAGRKLLDLYNNSKRKKPIVVLKPGKSRQSQMAIKSHTGSMAGDYEAISVALRQNGFILAENEREFYNIIKYFSWMESVKGKNVAIVTNAGGLGIMTTDKLVSEDFDLARMTEKTKTQLKKALPKASSISGVIDILGDADSIRYRNSIEIAIKDENVDFVIVLLTPQYVTEIKQTATTIIELAKLSDKPIIPVFFVHESMFEIFDIFNKNKYLAFDHIDDAIKTLAYAYENYNSRKKSTTLDFKKFVNKKLRKKYLDKIEKAIKDKQEILDDEIAFEILKDLKFSLPRQKIVKNLEELKQFANSYYPVVLKAPNSLIAHKTDVKAVFLSIKDEDQLIKTFNELKKNISGSNKHNEEKYLVQEQLKFEQEFFIGAIRDGSKEVYSEKNGFGYLMIFGYGGVYTEIIKDLAHVNLPADENQIKTVLEESKVYKILSGARGKKPLPISKVMKTIMLVQELLLTFPEIKSVDFNPVLIGYDFVSAVDVKIYLDEK